MKALPWIVAGIGVGLLAYIAFTNRELWYVIESDGVEKAARRAFGWGTRQRAAGTGGQVIGKLKEGLGRLSGNDDLAARGLADQIGGAAMGAVGSVAQAAAETMHELNR
jgi:uncharacterized protein YjbJ (UPF0337 family)